MKLKAIFFAVSLWVDYLDQWKLSFILNFIWAEKKTLRFKVFRYSFSEAIPIFFNRLKSVFSLSDRYKILTSNWLWIELCANVVLSKIDITMTTINKKIWNW